MECPFHKHEYVGVCIAYDFPYIPSLEERKSFCLNPCFNTCPVLNAAGKSSDKQLHFIPL